MKISQTSIIRNALLIAGSLTAAAQLQAQITSIDPGNIYLLQAGDGVTTAGSGEGAPALIDEFNTSQSAGGGTANGFVAQTALPTTPASDGGNFLTQGQGQQDGQLFYDPVGNTLAFGGYSGTPVNASINNPAANRDIGQLSSGGTFSFAVQNANEYGGNNTSGGLLRGAATDGNGNYWASGTASSGGLQGVWYYGGGTPAALLGTGISTRGLEIYGGNLFYTTGSGLSMISGTPKSGTQTPTLLFAAGATPYGFTMSPNMLTAYVANESGGIVKAVYSGTFSGGAYSGGTWTTTTIDSGTKFDWVTADFSKANPVIYATTLASSTGNQLDQIVDNGGSDPVTLLDTITGTSADSGNYDGLVFIPTPTPEPSVCALAGLGLLLSVGKWLRRK